MNASSSSSMIDSSPSRPSLRAIWDHPTIFSTTAMLDGSGGRTTHTASRIARTKIASGDCTIAAPMVPPSTMSSAGPLTRALRCPPSRNWPSRIAATPTSSPMMLRGSMGMADYIAGSAA